MKVLLTGASGYIGRNVMAQLKKDYEIIAVSRNIDNKEDEENVEWRKADLYSQLDIESAMEGVHTAIYLVHSMQPSSKLTQGTFGDMDAILADNFARAARGANVKKIIYLSGIIPDERPLSNHLESRLECEKILGSYGVPVTTLRAGLIVGPNGSSFPILHSLVKRLPGLLLPAWAYNKTHPVALKDVVDVFKKAIKRKNDNNEAIDIGGPDEMTYRAMFEETAEVMNKKMPMIDVPIIPVFLSKLWVRLIAQMPKEMVYPLLESLTHNMTMREEHFVEGISDAPTSFKEAVRIAFDETKEQPSKKKKGFNIKKEIETNDVKSIQRIKVPAHWTVDNVADYYVNWLSRIGGRLLNTSIVDGEVTEITLPLFKNPILILERSETRSYDDRILYYIKGGTFAFVREEGRARLEFRRILDTDEILIALHEYEPTLPWFIYSLTQARVHMIVMKLFGMETRLLSNMLNSEYVMYINRLNQEEKA